MIIEDKEIFYVVDFLEGTEPIEELDLRNKKNA